MHADAGPDAASPAWLTTTPIAHRGLHTASIPENSLAAFANAAEHGVGIELDVHVSRDGELIVFHDDDTRRLTGRPGLVADATLEELRRLRLAGTDERIPTLTEVLDLVAGRVPILIELKPGSDPRRVGPLVQAALSGYAGPAAVMSFDPRIVRWFGVHAPQICRGQLGGSVAGRRNPVIVSAVHLMALNGLSRPQFLAYDVRAASYRALAFWRRRLATPVLLWTVRTEADLATARTAGANVIFEGLDPAQLG